MTAVQSKRSFSMLWLLVIGALLSLVLPNILGVFSMGLTLQDETAVRSPIPTEIVVEDGFTVGGTVVRSAERHEEAEAVFTWTVANFLDLVPDDLKIRVSRQFRNLGQERILVAVKHPKWGWSGIFVRKYLDTNFCSVPTVFAFESEGWMKTIIARDGYIHSLTPADFLDLCGGFPKAPKFGIFND